MKNILNKFTKQARLVRLQKKEKLLMRERLLAHVSKASLSSQKPILSPWFGLFNFHYARVMPIALITLLFVGGGVSFAAQGALPGDFLYPIKVNINEKVEAGLSFSEVAKAKLEVKLAGRRLEEAEKLASENKLDAQTSADIEVRFKAHAVKADEKINKISDSEASAALNVASRFEASLKAHEAVLSKFESSNSAMETASVADTQARGTPTAAMFFKAEIQAEGSSTLGGSVRNEIEKTSDTRTRLEAKLKKSADIEARTEDEVQQGSTTSEEKINVNTIEKDSAPEVKVEIKDFAPQVNSDSRFEIRGGQDIAF